MVTNIYYGNLVKYLLHNKAVEVAEVDLFLYYLIENTGADICYSDLNSKRCWHLVIFILYYS